MDCVPPKHVRQFGEYRLSLEYRDALYDHASYYNTEEIVGSYLGYNDEFPSQDKWEEDKWEEDESEEDELLEEDESEDDSEEDDSEDKSEHGG